MYDGSFLLNPNQDGLDLRRTVVPSTETLCAGKHCTGSTKHRRVKGSVRGLVSVLEMREVLCAYYFYNYTCLRPIVPKKRRRRAPAKGGVTQYRGGGAGNYRRMHPKESAENSLRRDNIELGIDPNQQRLNVLSPPPLTLLLRLGFHLFRRSCLEEAILTEWPQSP